jgi:LuxR family maltose regulon positive regulatory protein
MVLAELWIAQKQTKWALELLEEWLPELEALQRTDSAIKALVLIALAHAQEQNLDRALAALAQALALARPGRYVRTFVDRGQPMTSLLRQALAQGIAVDDVKRLLAAFAPDTAPPAEHPAFVEPLSEREQEVLRLLATHLTSAEIGQTLYISANTVRFHTKNIYAKLDVHTRGDAVRQAQELGLI